MRLVRVGPKGHERPAVLVPGAVHEAYDVSALTGDYDSSFFGSGGLLRLAEATRTGSLTRIDLRSERVGPPIARPHAIYGIGLNYRDHAREMGMEPPAEPIVFTKAPNTLVGPYDDIVLPPGSTRTDWEVELGVVIGLTASYLPSPAAAADHIAGLVAVNDLSEREAQLDRGGQWVKGKSFETFNPTGPYLTTLDEVSDVRALQLRLAINGEVMQDSSTSELIFDPYYLVWYLSQFAVLEPGDLIATGTPAGVGMSHRPPRYLQRGDLVELEITCLGSHRARVR